jgi:hypothetical protein
MNVTRRLGWWAIRFLAAAGACHVGCSTELEPSGGNPFPCRNPQPYGNPESGLEQCDGGMLRRVSAGTCQVAASDARGGCLVDSDCGPVGDYGSICFCNELGAGHCAAADCSSDADCAEGFSCVGAVDRACSALPVFACQGASDQCGSDTDCAAGRVCVWGTPFGSEGPAQTCGACGVGGRPFLIEAAARTARTEPSSAWLEPSLKLTTGELSDGLRAHLAAHWQQQAELEHASVAAFARFILELLSLAAPPQLVSAATSALADETAHARLCYALASTYAGRELGPGKLDVTGALDELGASDIVTRAVLEGCVGETLAAIEASEAASRAADETLRQVLSRIAEDEARHAELSWRFVRWALSRGDAELRSVVRKAFGQARGELVARVNAVATRAAFDAELPRHGVLSASSAVRLALEVFQTVIGPCADALLAEPAVAPAPARAAVDFPKSRNESA